MAWPRGPRAVRARPDAAPAGDRGPAALAVQRRPLAAAGVLRDRRPRGGGGGQAGDRLRHRRPQRHRRATARPGSWSRPATRAGLRGALGRLCGEPELRQRMGEAARERAQLFGPEADRAPSSKLHTSLPSRRRLKAVALGADRDRRTPGQGVAPDAELLSDQEAMSQQTATNPAAEAEPLTGAGDDPVAGHVRFRPGPRRRGSSGASATSPSRSPPATSTSATSRPLLGAAWAVLQPVLTMVVFSVVFGHLARLPSDGLPYPVFAYSALVPWTYFASVLAQAPKAWWITQRLITKVYLPRIMVPLAPVVGRLVDLASRGHCAGRADSLLWHHPGARGAHPAAFRSARRRHRVRRRPVALGAQRPLPRCPPHRCRF